MSHNILKLNSGSFDVNSNKTETVNTTVKYAYVTGGFSSVLYGTPTTGSDLLLDRVDVVNTFNTSTEFDFINDTTHTGYVRYFRFKADGVYRIMAKGLLSQTGNNVFGSSQGMYLHDQTNPISNTFHKALNTVNYRRMNTLYGIVERSGTDIDVSIRVRNAGQISSSSVVAYRHSLVYVEKLQ